MPVYYIGAPNVHSHEEPDRSNDELASVLRGAPPQDEDGKGLECYRLHKGLVLLYLLMRERERTNDLIMSTILSDIRAFEMLKARTSLLPRLCPPV